MDPEGNLTTEVTVPDPGRHRVFADFKHDGENQTLAQDKFPTAGRYKLFLQFKREGEIHTAAFTRVAR